MDYKILRKAISNTCLMVVAIIIGVELTLLALNNLPKPVLGGMLFGALVGMLVYIEYGRQKFISAIKK